VADVTVTPQDFTMVHFDPARIEALASTLADQIGIDAPVGIEIDQTTPMGRVWVESIDPIVIKALSGGFEDPRRPRHLSEDAVTDVLGRLLFRVRDRRDDAFGDPPPDDDLTLAQATAWDTYAVGRCARLGYPVNRQRRLYHFRNRHGFSDLADGVFDRLWEAEGLTWADLIAACDETEETRTPVG
jgi:hypothetical protein